MQRLKFPQGNFRDKDKEKAVEYDIIAYRVC